MSKDINLLDSLIINESIQIGKEATTWQNAIELLMMPLIKSKAIEKSYIDAIIKSTEKYGPYYILSENIAMPHAGPEHGVNKDSFSLMVLNKSVKFQNDDRNIRVLIGLASTSSDIHVSSALPQVVAVFEEQKNVDKMIKAKSIQEIKDIISKIDFSKYLT